MLFKTELDKDNSPVDDTKIVQVLLYYSEEEAAEFKNLSKVGMKEIFYDISGREAETVKRMVEMWGPQICVPVVKPDGRNDVSINWKLIGKTETNLF